MATFAQQSAGRQALMAAGRTAPQGPAASRPPPAPRSYGLVGGGMPPAPQKSPAIWNGAKPGPGFTTAPAPSMGVAPPQTMAPAPVVQPRQVADRPFYGQRQGVPQQQITASPPMTVAPAQVPARPKTISELLGNTAGVAGPQSGAQTAQAMSRPRVQTPGMGLTAGVAGPQSSAQMAQGMSQAGAQAPMTEATGQATSGMGLHPGSGQTPQTFGEHDAMANAARNELDDRTVVQGKAQADTGSEGGEYVGDQAPNGSLWGIINYLQSIPSLLNTAGNRNAEDNTPGGGMVNFPGIQKTDASGKPIVDTNADGSQRRPTSALGNMLGDVATAATDVLDPARQKLSEADMKAIKEGYGWDPTANNGKGDFSGLAGMDKIANEQFGSDAMNTAEQAAQDKLNSQIGMQRDAEMRQLLAAQGRGGAVGQGRFNAVNNSALMAQQAGQRDLAMDAYNKRRQAAQDLLAQLNTSDEARRGMLGEGIMTNEDLLALLMEGADKSKGLLFGGG